MRYQDLHERWNKADVAAGKELLALARSPVTQEDALEALVLTVPYPPSGGVVRYNEGVFPDTPGFEEFLEEVVALETALKNDASLPVTTRQAAERVHGGITDWKNTWSPAARRTRREYAFKEKLRDWLTAAFPASMVLAVLLAFAYFLRENIPRLRALLGKSAPAAGGAAPAPGLRCLPALNALVMTAAGFALFWGFASYGNDAVMAQDRFEARFRAYAVLAGFFLQLIAAYLAAGTAAAFLFAAYLKGLLDASRGRTAAVPLLLLETAMMAPRILEFSVFLYGVGLPSEHFPLFRALFPQNKARWLAQTGPQLGGLLLLAAVADGAPDLEAAFARARASDALRTSQEGARYRDVEKTGMELVLGLVMLGFVATLSTFMLAAVCSDESVSSRLGLYRLNDAYLFALSGAFGAALAGSSFFTYVLARQAAKACALHVASEGIAAAAE